MSTICSAFDTYFDKWCGEIGALCFLLAPDRGHSRDQIAFQSFLRLGGAKDHGIGEEDARMLLFSSAVRLCDDYYLKKMRRRPSRAALESASLPFPVTDAVCALLRLPFARRAALALSLFGFSQEEIARILHKREGAVKKLLIPPEIDGWQDAVRSMAMTEGEAAHLSDRIYERFAERTVPVENAIHDFRNAFDRAAPYLALGVLAIFALAVWVSARV